MLKDRPLPIHSLHQHCPEEQGDHGKERVREKEADGQGRARERDERPKDAGRPWGGRDRSRAVGKAEFPAWQSSVGHSMRSEAEP